MIGKIDPEKYPYYHQIFDLLKTIESLSHTYPGKIHEWNYMRKDLKNSLSNIDYWYYMTNNMRQFELSYLALKELMDEIYKKIEELLKRYATT